jgi:hypothetical protein
MKNIYELPVSKDFLECDILRLIHADGAHFSVAQYRNGATNLRAIIDFREFNENITLFDESKSAEYTALMEQWNKDNYGRGIPQQTPNGVVMIPNLPQPQVPIKNVQLIGTVVIYHNGQERILMISFEEWKEKYYGYLQNQKLDITM